MIKATQLVDQINELGMDTWSELLPSLVEQALQHGDIDRWQNSINDLPDIKATHWDLDQSPIILGHADELSDAKQKYIRDLFLQLRPWRKGPFDLFGIHIDCEWRSDWKWNRLIEHIAPLTGRKILDVGCGNAYYGLRLLGSGADSVVGIEPHLLFHAQYLALTHFLPKLPLTMLPCAFENLPAVEFFDTVLSLGVIYHRRSPLDHLQQLFRCLKPGGQLVLESLVIEDEKNRILIPPDRYARMRNVWFIPSPDSLLTWINRCGFTNARLVDVSITTIEEQRQTEWMPFESLAQCLHPKNLGQTVEGLPAPRRAIVTAEK